MPDLVVSLSDAIATDPAVTGGKGSALAKLEGRIALETLLARIPDYEVATKPEMHGSFLIRGPKDQQLRWRSEAAPIARATA